MLPKVVTKHHKSLCHVLEQRVSYGCDSERCCTRRSHATPTFRAIVFYRSLWRWCLLWLQQCMLLPPEIHLRDVFDILWQVEISREGATRLVAGAYTRRSANFLFCQFQKQNEIIAHRRHNIRSITYRGGIGRTYPLNPNILLYKLQSNVELVFMII